MTSRVPPPSPPTPPSPPARPGTASHTPTSTRLSDEEFLRASWLQKLKWRVLGRPRDPCDRSLWHTMALIPLLAWIGLGADALSSSAYGPEECFKAIGSSTYLAIALAAATALTVAMISASYAALIENFPTGGGYGVASKLLGDRLGLVSGCALLVDYVLTITTSIAAAGDAIYSFLPDGVQSTKVMVEAAVMGGLTILNLRGVRESIVVLTPMFLLFVATHVVLIGVALTIHPAGLHATAHAMRADLRHDLGAIGALAIFKLFCHAYSLGGGTYTGIEAVSNSLPLMREPRVATAKRTMLYLATSLAITAGGLLVCYLLWHISKGPDETRTMNAMLATEVGKHLPLGGVFVVLTLVSEAALLIVAAQAGFLGGPRVLANMAVDSWMPHAFSSISERLITSNGIAIMAGAALLALLVTDGKVDTLVVMYSINVFLTFTLTMLGMTRFWWRQPRGLRRWRRIGLFSATAVLCSTILVITSVEKFAEGAWLTMLVTIVLVVLCMLIRWHYRSTSRRAIELYRELGRLPLAPEGTQPLPLARENATAVILVGAYGGLGIHTFLNIMRVFPGHYRQVVFISVGVVDSGTYKGVEAVDELNLKTEEMLDRYVRLATAMRLPASSRFAVGIDAVEEAEKACLAVAQEFPRSVFFAGKLIFEHERWYHRLLHNNSAIVLQKRLHWSGKAMMVMPARIVEHPRHHPPPATTAPTS